MFKIVPDYEFAMVNEQGVVKSAHTGNILKPHEDKDGYRVYSVWCPIAKSCKRLSQHRAIAKTFIPNPENKPEVNHIDSNRKNNEILNLEWCTAKENHTHGLLYGEMLTGRLGEDNTNSKLKETQVHEICQLLEAGLPTVEIQNITGVGVSSIFDIKSRAKWIEISDNYKLPLVSKNLSEDRVHNICKDIIAKLNDKDINSKYSLGRGTLRNIKTKKTFKHITSLYEMG